MLVSIAYLPSAANRIIASHAIGSISSLAVLLLLLTQHGLYGETPPVGAATGQATALDLKPYAADWRTLKGAHLEATLDSRGQVSVDTDGAQLVFGLDGQNSGNFWKKATVRDRPGTGVEMLGFTRGDLHLKQTVTVVDDTIICIYRADKPFQVVGRFPTQPQANWFRSKDDQGVTVQGELWGTFRDLELHDSLEYTYGQRRLRLIVGPREPLTLQACRDYSLPATFRLNAHRGKKGYLAGLKVISLSPSDAPLAPSGTPVVTRPFDRNKLITGPLTAFPPPPGPRFVPRKGHPAIFKRQEPLAFQFSWNASEQTSSDSLTLRCVNAMNDKIVESRTLDGQSVETFDFTLQPVAPGPYRIELLRSGTKVGEEEFVVVCSIRRTIGR